MLGAETGMVQVTADLNGCARDLAQLAYDFRSEARSWTHPGARERLEDAGRQLTSWAQAAALEASRGDYWSRFEALQLALHRRSTARLTLRQWWQRGELFNSHRLRPVPASIQLELDDERKHTHA